MRNEIEKLCDELREFSAFEPLADKRDAILANPGDDYKRGVVDGMTASANFVAAAHLQGRDNDRMRLADSLRSEAKRVEQEK